MAAALAAADYAASPRGRRLLTLRARALRAALQHPPLPVLLPPPGAHHLFGPSWLHCARWVVLC